MSRQFALDVLEKIAQITTILVDTSKIKEYLDNNSKNDEILKDVIEKTKVQVENLCVHTAAVKELFDKKYKKLEDNISSEEEETRVNGETGEESSDRSLNIINSSVIENNNDQDIAQPNKPLIKLVDINKLVEPKSAIKKEFNSTNSKKSVQIDTSVVIISSDEELPPSRRNSTLTKTTRRTLKVNRNSQKSEKSKNKLRNGRKTRINLDNIALSDTSSSLSSEEVEKLETYKISKDHISKYTKNGNYEEFDGYDWEKDPKFKAESYVKVIRVPCERLKEYYLEKLELLEVKKLRSIDNLSYKKSKNSQSDMDDSSDEGMKKNSENNKAPENLSNKEGKKRKKNDKTDSENSSDSDNNTNAKKAKQNERSESSEDEPSSDRAEKENETLSNPQQENCNEEMADFAMAMLQSDTENQPAESEAESDIEKDPLMDNVQTEVNNEDTDKIDKTTPEEENSEETNKNDETVDELSENQDEDKKEEDNDKKDDNNASENENKAENKEDGVEDSSDQEKETGEEMEGSKATKTWRKDKLLTMKLSSSDTEEEMEKIRKKKEKQQENVKSEEQAEIPLQKKKRKMKKRVKQTILSDSDSDGKKKREQKSSDDFQTESSSSSSESEEEKQPEKKKSTRKRVKRVQDSSEEDDDDKNTRKQIRKVWGRDSLAETTKQAEAEEKERKARISEKQKKYNQIFDNTYEKNATVDKVVLDFDEKNNKELLTVEPEIVSKLKPHQASGVQFMWDACYESLERAKSTKGSGCILAHCMGLGKTLQVIALTHTLLTNSEKTGVKKVMVVSPLNTVLNWVNEYKKWLPDLDDFDVYELVSSKQNHERLYNIRLWHNHGGVLIIGYDMFRNLSNSENKRISKKMRTSFQEALVDPGPDLVVCDEGHLLKNEKTNTSIAMNRLKTMRRIVLTGTPLQNNLKEYFCMVQFIKPNLLGTYKEYLNRFVNPITNGQYTDSTPHDIQVMRRRSHVLHKMLDGVVQRRDYAVLQPYLPPKHEFILFLSLTPTQIKLYQHYLDHFARKGSETSNRTSYLFNDFQALQRICTHPRVLLDKSIEMKAAKDKLDSDEDSIGSLKDFINDDEDSTSASESDESNSDEDGSEKKKSSRRRVRTRAAVASGDIDDEPILIEDKKEWWQQYCDGDELNVISHSSKLFMLFEILKECEQIGDKILIFSQSLYSLNVIEYFLERIHLATQDDDSVEGYTGSWCLGLDYFRLDGSSSCDNRSAWCKTFNDPKNTRARLFLISTKAGGLGINLVAANRVIIFDVSWNPSHDIQSIYRVYRFGQTKPCYIYRFVTQGTMEMKIYERQVTKQAISKRVIDEQQIDRHYNQNDLQELYKFEPKPDDRPTPLVPKDILLAEMLQKYEHRIYSYHEHQSLLENKEEECLNEDERKAAWEEFENEKTQRTTAGAANLFTSQNISNGIFLVIKKDYPTLSDMQIRQIFPNYFKQYQEQISKGDLTLHRRMQQELQIFYFQNQLMQQQAMKNQQAAAAMRNDSNTGGWFNQVANHLPGTSGSNFTFNPNEVIELND